MKPFGSGGLVVWVECDELATWLCVCWLNKNNATLPSHTQSTWLSRFLPRYLKMIVWLLFVFVLCPLSHESLLFFFFLVSFKTRFWPFYLERACPAESAVTWLVALLPAHSWSMIRARAAFLKMPSGFGTVRRAALSNSKKSEPNIFFHFTVAFHPNICERRTIKDRGKLNYD